MRRLSRSTTKPTLWMLPCQNLVDRAENGQDVSRTVRYHRRSHAPLLVVGVQDDAHHAETVECPVQEPGLAGILADVARWEALYEISDEKLEVLLALEGWQGLWIER